ncbi:MAG: GAF domain-containing sensor histidine kinase [Thermoleophilia bacterium]|nr:GAF domain-containing sensor histidine kinase [Thermoleophilia bacterium]
MAYETLTESQLRRVLEAGRSLVSEPDLEKLLEQVLSIAMELTGAGHAALGVFDQEEVGLERFHPRTSGFPPEAPNTDPVVRVPIEIRGETFGSIYLTDRADGDEFDDRDKAILGVLAEWAALAIDNARGYEETERRRAEFERAVQTLEATVSLSRTGAAETDLPSLLDLISKRGRTLVQSRSLLVLFADPDVGLMVAAVDGEFSTSLEQEVPGGNVLLEKARLDGLVHHTEGRILDLPDGDIVRAGSAMLVHLSHAGRSQGFLLALERTGQDRFTPDDELVFQSFASSAANSLAIAKDEQRERLRATIEASERERRRWAIELHDQTLQDLGALKVMHEGALSRGDPQTMRRSLVLASSQIDDSIASLESLIQELRPPTLDLLGVAAAVETLVERMDNRTEMALTSFIDLGYERGDRPTRLAAQLEATIYRAVQEALNNSVKHAEATKVSVSIVERDDQVTIFVEDDGKGFSPAGGTGERFGLHGMRERVEMVGGELEIDSAPGSGTRVEVRLPVQLQSVAGAG